jgi:hypothetical protein
MVTANRMNLQESKVLMNIEKYGNTTSATLPLVLNDFVQGRYHYFSGIWRRIQGSIYLEMGIRQTINLN